MQAVLKRLKRPQRIPKGLLGWTFSFAEYGIRLFSLYLYGRPLPSKAAASIAHYVGFKDDIDFGHVLDFENAILEESRKNNVSAYFGIIFKDGKLIFQWIWKNKDSFKMGRKNVRKKTDAIVGGQHRNQYAEVAMLLEVDAEIEEYRENKNARLNMFAEYT